LALASECLASPAAALSPEFNVRYAASLLRRYRARTGTWAGAVGLYHSHDSRIADAYRCRLARQLVGGDPMRIMFIGLLALLAVPTLAQSQSESDRCADPRISPNQVLDNCTAAIQSGTEKPNNLVADYDNRALAYLKLGMNDKAIDDEIDDENRSLAISEGSNAHIVRGSLFPQRPIGTGRRGLHSRSSPAAQYGRLPKC